jgi:hypothetical protein
MLPKNRPPAHPGEILLSEFLEPKGITQSALAEKLEIPMQRVNTLINGKRPEAMLLERVGRPVDGSPNWRLLEEFHAESGQAPDLAAAPV